MSGFWSFLDWSITVAGVLQFLGGIVVVLIVLAVLSAIFERK